jgi:hypothetical protein
MIGEVVTCECGGVWKLRKIKTIMRDIDTFNCTCGRELISWNGGHMWAGELVSKPKAISK